MTSSKNAFSLDIGVVFATGSTNRVGRLGTAAITWTVIGDIKNGDEGSSYSSSSASRDDSERAWLLDEDDGKCNGLLGSCNTQAAIEKYAHEQVSGDDNQIYSAPLPKWPHSPPASWTASSTTTSALVCRAISFTISSRYKSPPSIGVYNASVGSTKGPFPAEYVARCCVCGCNAMCRLCSASLNTSDGGSNELGGLDEGVPSGTSSGLHRTLRPEGRGTESTASFAVEARVRRLGFSSGSSDGGGSAALGGGPVGEGAEPEGSGTSGAAAVSDEIARRERRGVEGCEGVRSFRGYRRACVEESCARG